MESRSRSKLRGAWLNVRTESSQRQGNHNATISKSREQFLLRLTLSLPCLRLTVKTFQFLRLSTKFLAVLRLSFNPIETFLDKLCS